MIVLVRGHDADLEVFWVRRSDAVAVQPGFRAFIGGKVDASDADLPLEGLEDEVERAAAACAIREAFEEAGVLIGAEGEVDPAALPQARARLLAGIASFPELVSEHGWRFSARALAFAGRWQTPVFAPVRFDALYFLARVPEGQEPHVLPGELAEGSWVKPGDAIDLWRRGEATFAAPILWTLVTLAEGENDLAARLVEAPHRAGTPVQRIEMKWGVVLHPMRTRPLPPASHTNAWFIGEREMVLLDPGSDDEAELAKLFALADALAADGRHVSRIVVTHHHPDHTGGVAACRKRFRVPVEGHPLLAGSLAIDRALAHGEEIHLADGEAGDWRLVVHHTPGHTRDSLCLVHPRTRSLWCGDLVPGGHGSVIIDPPDGDMRVYLDSLAHLLAQPVETLFPAHGSPQGAAHRRILALIAHRHDRERKVIEALAEEPRGAHELLAEVYADTPRELWKWAERSLLAHLLKLEGEGRAVRDADHWRLA